MRPDSFLNIIIEKIEADFKPIRFRKIRKRPLKRGLDTVLTHWSGLYHFRIDPAGLLHVLEEETYLMDGLFHEL